MAIENLNSNPSSIDKHIERFTPELKLAVNSIRAIVLGTHQQIGERIKWNNPSFFYTGEMKTFNPKEFKRELLVLNLFKGRIMLVFPSGARVDDGSGFLTGDYKDGRRILVFENQEEIKAKEKKLKTLIKNWINTLDK